MQNQVMNEIKAFAVKKLNEAYGFAGEADCDDQAWLNSSDNQGNDFKIIFKVENDSEDGE